MAVIVSLVASLILGFAIGYVCCELGHKKREVKKFLRDHFGRKFRQRRDTETNIGNRFARVVRTYCPKDIFAIESQLSEHGGYWINVWGVKPRRGRLFSMSVNLAYTDEHQISGSMESYRGEDRHFNYPIDENSIQLAIKEVSEFLKTL